MGTRLSRGRFFGRPRLARTIGDLLLVDSQHAAGSHLPRHSHENAYFCLNHGGTYTEDYGRRRRTCTAGTLVFHPPGESHSETHYEAVASLNVEVGPTWLRRFADLGWSLDQPMEFRCDDVAAAGLQILAELRRGDEDSSMAIEALAWEVLAAASAHGPVGRESRPGWLRHVKDLLDGRFGERLTLKSIAATVGVHPVHLAATFRRSVGCSVGEYLRRRRIQCARRELALADRSLTQIALAAGFADQSHLTRMFKRFTGMTPGQYRTFLAFKTR